MPVGGRRCWFGHSVGHRASGGAGPVLKPDTMAARVAACTACHGEQGRAGSDGYYPRLAGKPQEYLYHQLLNFRDDRRQYRPMSHLLAGLPDDYLREIAAYFADQHVPYPAAVRPEVSTAILEAGRKLAQDGDAARGLPACAACHGAALGGLLPGVPGLLACRATTSAPRSAAGRTGCGARPSPTAWRTWPPS